MMGVVKMKKKKPKPETLLDIRRQTLLSRSIKSRVEDQSQLEPLRSHL